MGFFIPIGTLERINNMSPVEKAEAVCAIIFLFLIPVLIFTILEKYLDPYIEKKTGWTPFFGLTILWPFILVMGIFGYLFITAFLRIFHK